MIHAWIRQASVYVVVIVSRSVDDGGSVGLFVEGGEQIFERR